MKLQLYFLFTIVICRVFVYCVYNTVSNTLKHYMLQSNVYILDNTIWKKRDKYYVRDVPTDISSGKICVAKHVDLPQEVINKRSNEFVGIYIVVIHLINRTDHLKYEFTSNNDSINLNEVDNKNTEVIHDIFSLFYMDFNPGGKILFNTAYFDCLKFKYNLFAKEYR